MQKGTAGKIRLGVAGAGTIAQGWHLPHFAQHPAVELVALADPNGERLAQVGDEFGIAQGYADPKQMIDEAELDALVIATPANSHAELAVTAMKAGLDVLVEKPMARTLAEAELMANTAKAEGRILMLGMVRRYSRESQALKQITQSGQLGELYYGRASSFSRRGVPGGWFTDKEVAGGGAMLDIGVHALDLAWYLMGCPEPIAVSGQTFREVSPYQTAFTATGWSAASRGAEEPFTVEEGGVAMIRFQGGRSLMLEAFWAVNGPPEEGFNVRLYGQQGGALFNPLQVSFEQNGLLLDATPVLTAKMSMWQEQSNHFIACLQERREPISSATHGLQVMRMLQGIYDSTTTGREVQL